MNRRVGSVDVCDKKLLHRRSTSDFNRPWTSWQEINGTIIGADFLKVAHKKETHGFTAMIKKDFSEAVLHFSEAIGINPKKALIWLQRCKCLMSLGQFELAAKDAMMAISLSKNFFNPYYRLIDCYLNLDEIDKAEDVIVEILNVAPSINATITNRYESFERFKTLKNIIDLTKYCEPDKCLVALQETLRLAPASIDHQFLRLQILAALGNSDLQNEKFFHHDVPKMLAAYFAGNLVVSLKIMNKVSLKRESKSFERFKTMLIKIVAGIKSGLRTFLTSFDHFKENFEKQFRRKRRKKEEIRKSNRDFWTLAVSRCLEQTIEQTTSLQDWKPLLGVKGKHFLGDCKCSRRLWNW